MSHLHNKQSATKKLPYTAVLGRGMLRNNALLTALLNQPVKRWYPWYLLSKQQRYQVKQFAGWGHKKSYQRAYRTADRLNKPAISVEDGFLRSLDAGIHSRFGCSVVIDAVGIYFDATDVSTLEQYILHAKNDWSANMQQRAVSCIHTITKHHLSKYNKTPQTLAKLPTTGEHKNKVLVIDQVLGDESVKGAGASQKQFLSMLKQACRNHLDADIYIKAHPAAKAGYLTTDKVLSKLSNKQRQRIHIIECAVNPILLLQQMAHVYTVSSHMGFEALMLGIKVHCFGVAWYSGWGLTDDQYAPQRLLQQVKQRRMQSVSSLDLSRVDTQKTGNRFVKNKVLTALQSLLPVVNLCSYTKNISYISATLEQLFYAAYIDYSHYADPAAKQSCAIEQSMQWLVTNRDASQRLPDFLTIYEFSRWKLPFVRDFLTPAVGSLSIKPKPRLKNLLHPKHFMVDYQQDLLVWGLAKRLQLEKRCKDNKVDTATANIWCMEDGFIRSNGLGATLLEPLSVVIDKQGIYYDATRPSDLEDMLRQCASLTQAEQQRVSHLHQLLLERQVSKYNVGKHNSLSIPITTQSSLQEVCLIIGQVEDDLSVQYCGSLICSNAQLIQRVRADHPKAYLIYKPHPDVEAGLRIGRVNQRILTLVDHIAYDTAIAECLSVVDTVHTISSLTGFEALLRGKKVVCYGLPFYAGWGLTEDKDCELLPKANFLLRRQRTTQLTLQQMIYCALIRYPLYHLPKGHGLAQVEQIIDYLYNQPESIPVQNAKNILNQRFMQIRKHWLSVYKLFV
ncbi:capsular polysaccharide biosynthesis protein [Psychrobacter sp. I-STPA10]|uniref:capsular polysaccharide biosynthesis protein n=1 Tax=Psychrobacter sp. I-STPA10 TaxID=2585769 RepID=UPI001E2EBB17|nr:capsular polysaccharide biosynthesis protein [Psychrobacter sp. I-STPA10]